MKIKRAFGEIKAISEDVEKTRTVEFVISTEAKDRHGTVLSIDGWILNKYNKNPIVGYQHDVYGDSFFKSPDPDTVIGKSKVYVEDKKLIGAVTFEPPEINPLAEKVFRKILFGTLRAASVGFLPIEKGRYVNPEGSDGGTYYYGKRELLEWSIVNIPSNSDAIRRQLEDDLLEDEEPPVEIEKQQEELKDNQEPVGVPEHEKLRLKIELTKIV